MAPVARNNKPRTVLNVTRRVTNAVSKLQGGSGISLPAVKKFLSTEKNIKIPDDEIKIAFKKALDKGVLSKEGRKYKVAASRMNQSITDNKSSRSQVSIKQAKEQASSSKVGKRLSRVEKLSEACMPDRSAKVTKQPKNTIARNTLFSSQETLNTQERNVDGMEDNSIAIVEVPKKTVDLIDDQSSEAANRVQDNLPMDQDAEGVNRVQDNLPMDQDAEDVNEVPPDQEHQEPVLESDEAPNTTTMIEQEIP